ncbi:hypothetical protein CXF68_01790 [Tenacibaculum sp. Bg11-29]|nr:hypothetical protein CXF68_01790 [Tenacibaculum sp. Bg11-29]
MYFYTFNFLLMRHILFIFFSFVLIASSCKNKNVKRDAPVKKTGMNTAIKHSKNTPLNETPTKEIKNWKEYFILKDFIQLLKNTSPTEALNNALELKKLTKHLKDSLNIETLKTPAFKARMNVFENEVLRLTDMTYIPSITSKEINNQVNKVLDLYGGMNDKINTVYIKKRFDKEIKLDSIFKFE